MTKSLWLRTMESTVSLLDALASVITASSTAEGRHRVKIVRLKWRRTERLMLLLLDTLGK